MKISSILLWGGLIVTVAASLWPIQKPIETIELVDKKTAKHSLAKAPALLASVGAAKTITRQWNDQGSTNDIFYVKQKSEDIALEKAAEIKQATPVYEPPPQALPPPLPFIYLGQMVNEGKVTVYLNKADRNYSVKGGETIDGIYNVVSVDQQKVVFHYKPLATEQLLIIGGAN